MVQKISPNHGETNPHPRTTLSSLHGTGDIKQGIDDILINPNNYNGKSDEIDMNLNFIKATNYAIWVLILACILFIIIIISWIYGTQLQKYKNQCKIIRLGSNLNAFHPCTNQNIMTIYNLTSYI